MSFPNVSGVSRSAMIVFEVDYPGKRDAARASPGAVCFDFVRRLTKGESFGLRKDICDKKITVPAQVVLTVGRTR